MLLRYTSYALFIVAFVTSSGCIKSKDTPEEHDDIPLEDQEQEPNDDRDHCDHFEDERPIVGTLSASDTDVICAKGQYTLHVLADSSVEIALEDPRGQRVELGKANGAEDATPVHLPGQDWVLVLRGNGNWRVEIPETPAEDRQYCGIRLIDEHTPIVLGIQDLPAVFPICAPPKVGAANVQFPSLVPAGVAGFEINVDGVGEDDRGLLRVRDQGKGIARVELAPGRRSPALRWGADALIDAELLIAAGETRKTFYLRVDPISTPDSPKEFLELEPNDTHPQAVRIPRPGSVAGVLHSLTDVDWFQVHMPTGDMRAEVLTQGDTKLKVQGVSNLGRQDALLGEDGVYRLCSLAEPLLEGEETTMQSVRISYATDAEESTGVYELSFAPVSRTTDVATPLGDVDVPTHAPQYPFGFVERQDARAQHGAGSQNAGGQNVGEQNNAGRSNDPPRRRFGEQPAEKKHARRRDNTRHSKRQGRIETSDVEHGWVFQVPPTDDDYHVSILARGHSTMDLKLRILDADGITVATVDKRAAGQDEELALELPTGFYVVAVKATGVQGCEGDYTLELSSDNARDGEENANGTPANRNNSATPTDAASSDSDEARRTGRQDQNARDEGAKSQQENRPDAHSPEVDDEIPDYPW